MTPREWDRSKHGKMLRKALDTQVLRLVARYNRMTGTFMPLVDALEMVRYVMAINLKHYGGGPYVPRAVHRLVEFHQKEAGGGASFLADANDIIRRLCVTWLSGGVETVDGSIVDHEHVQYVFKRWIRAAKSRIRADGGAFLRAISTLDRNPI